MEENKCCEICRKLGNPKCEKHPLICPCHMSEKKEELQGSEGSYGEIKEEEKTDKTEKEPVKESYKGQIGGYRPGSGRPKGGKNKATIERDTARRLFEERIIANIQELLSSQMNIAKGASYVYRIEESKNGKKEHILITNPEEIKQFLDELEGGDGVLEEGGDYYYITTKTPENKALDSLIDRVFGKAPQKLEHSGEIAHQITGMKIVKDDE